MVIPLSGNGGQPLISILVPVYNVERFLEECLVSIASQTWKNIEVIVVDDCSTDGTLEIARRFSERDPRIRVFHNETNRRIAATLNRAWSVARGEFIARCDGDDVMLPDRLEVQYKYLQAHPELSLAGCSFMTIDESGRELRVHQNPADPVLVKRLLPFKSPLSHIWLAKREVYERLNGYRISSVEDYDFLLRMDQAGYLFCAVPSYVGQKVRMRSGNTISLYGLTQRVLFNYVRKLYKNSAVAYSEEVEWSLVESSRASLLRYFHIASDRLTERGAKSKSRLLAIMLYLVGSLLSPYKAQHFYLQVRVWIVIKLWERERRALAVPAH